jgi:phospholipid/cholesterol/gamma-HCH transport system permease protein
VRVPFVEDTGLRALQFIEELGKTALFMGGILRSLVLPPVRVRRFVNELYDIGVLSLLLVGGSGIAVGMVLGLQGYNTLVRFGAEQSLGAVVGLAVIRELGPVLTGLLVTGRAGSAMAAEIGSMVTNEQLDGLRMMAIDPMHLVVTPKMVAMTAVMPLLSAIFTCASIFGGWLVGVQLLGLDGGVYLSSLEDAVDFNDDVLGSLLKAVVFGALVGLIATFRGYHARRSAAGVSAATTSTVVVSSVAILIVDYFITALWGV